jgi:dynactin complex subunit
MKAWIPLMLVFALGSAAHSQATCTYPKSPETPPDGATATKEQMIEGKHAFDAYNKEMNAYLDCLKLEMDSAVPKDTSKMSADDKKKALDNQKVLTQKNNAAVDELQANVGRFNEQLKIYKAKAAAK